MSAEDVESAPSPSIESRKRKRDDASEPTLEIDVSLPEPLSKKALRKAKRLNNGDFDSKSHQSTSAPPEAPSLPINGNKQPNPTKPPPSPHSIWIGNLPFSVTKPLLHNFLVTNAQPPIAPTAITRIHIPAPALATATKTTLKPQNKGFAYVDFADHASFLAALALSETPIAGRNVLIKDAKNFAGRPVAQEGQAANGDVGGSSKGGGRTQRQQKPPSPRVFVGNLGYEVTREDLAEFFAPCGEVLDVHVATFEDSGKCKGYAWVTFGSVEAAGLAVQGWVKVSKGEKRVDDDGEDGMARGYDGTELAEGEKEEDEKDAAQNVSNDDDDDDAEGNKKPASKSKPKSSKTQKWFVNRIQGRSIRCEYAEDPSIRYKKRFGKDAPSRDPNKDRSTSTAFFADENAPPPPPAAAPNKSSTSDIRDPNTSHDSRRNARDHPFGLEPGAPTDASKRRGRGRGARELSDKEMRREAKAREIAEKTRYRSGAVAESTGSKVVFDE